MSKEMGEKEIKSIIRQTINEMDRRGMIKKRAKTPHEETVFILYNLNKYRDAVSEKKKELQELQENGLPKKSKSITQYGGAGGAIENVSEMERLEETLRKKQDDIEILELLIEKVDAALDSIRQDYYYPIVEMIYFQGKTQEEVAEYFDLRNPNKNTCTSQSTISRNKNRLINELIFKLYPEKTVTELGIV